MKAPRRIAILHDSPDFGGHERAFLTWLPALLATPDIAEVQIQLPETATAFREALALCAHPKLRIAPSRYIKLRAEPYRAPFRVGYGRAAAAFVRRSRADLVLMLQGRIENLATPMLWLSRTIEMVSYLPMAHSGPEMGRSPVISGLTDAVKRRYYARPQRLIVPSQAVAAQARRAGARGPVFVVENVPVPAIGGRKSRIEARSALGLDPSERVALFMGRFESRQKGLDRLLRDLRDAEGRLDGWRFLFVGQGPAEADLRASLQRPGVRGEIVGWTPDPDSYLAAVDVLLAPSRFEGVPLVMLEALRQGLPILASDIDVYREYLPLSALFDFSRPVDLADALEALTAPDQLHAYRQHAAEVFSRLDLQTSQQRFVRALLGSPDPRPLAVLVPGRVLAPERVAP